MTKFAFRTLASCLLTAALAHAQRADLTFGASTLLSSSSNSASLTAVGPEKGGGYLALGGDLFFKRGVGVNVEGAWRAKQGLDAFGQPYRPILVDVNGVFQPRISGKVSADFMAGVGFQSTRFYGLTPTSTCPSIGTCYTSSNHFLMHIGGGLRYYVFRQLFFRPEVHYYHVNNNVQFHSDNIVRLGASIGYGFGRE